MKNFRELAFGNIKDKLLYRGEALNKLSKKDKNYLINESNIKTVIDLRTLEEHNKQKDKILPNVSYYHIPLVTLDEMGVSSEKDGKKQASKSKLPSMYDYYYKLIDKNKKDKWSEIFNILLKCEGGVYIHCTVGKDRTGVVVAVILKLLGVSEKLIYDDYLKTNEHPIYPFKYKLFSLTLKKETRKDT